MKKFFTLVLLLAAMCGVASAAAYMPVFQESFAKCKSTVIQGGYFSESTYFEAAAADNSGWTSLNAYTSERAIKFSAKTKTGNATSPAISFSSEVAKSVKVRFRAQAWLKDNVDVHVEFVGVEGSEQIIDSNSRNNISDRNEEPFELIFSNIPTGSRLKFSSTARDNKVTRFFLSDIVVFEEVEEASAPVLVPSAFYHHFNDIMVGNDSEERTVTLDIAGPASELKIGDTENFTVGQTTENVLNIRFTPKNAGSKEETLVITSGAIEQKIILTGNAKVYSPEIEEASGTSDNSFTANWKAFGMDKIVLTVYTKEEDKLVAPDLMFTKYIEGKSNNRAIEIFNGTGKDVSLDGYSLMMESNGAGGLTACEFLLPDQILEAGKTYTICNAQFAALRDIADKTIGFQDGGYANIMTFTGDDAIGLFDPNGSLIDLLGYESYDCNDRVSGLWGTDVTYYRRPECYQPHDKFYVEEWIEHPMDYCEGYGSHTMNETGLVRKIVEKVNVDGSASSYEVKGLDPGKTYYYAVYGVSNGFKTPSSKECAVTTAGTSGIGNVTADFTADTAVYNLHGIRVADDTTTLPAGIYIRAGKKLIVK